MRAPSSSLPVRRAGGYASCSEFEDSPAAAVPACSSEAPRWAGIRDSSRCSMRARRCRQARGGGQADRQQPRSRRAHQQGGGCRGDAQGPGADVAREQWQRAVGAHGRRRDVAGEVECVEERQAADEWEEVRLLLLSVRLEQAHDRQEVTQCLTRRDIGPDLGELRVQARLPVMQDRCRRETGRGGSDQQGGVRMQRRRDGRFRKRLPLWKKCASPGNVAGRQPGASRFRGPILPQNGQ